MKLLSGVGKAGEITALVALSGILTVVAAAWSQLPARVPVHFDLWGRPDRWGGKEFFVIFGGLAVFVYASLFVVQGKPQWVNIPFRVDRNDPEVRKLLVEMISVLKASILLVLLGIVVGAVEVAMGNADGLGLWMLPVVLMLAIGPTVVYLYKLRTFRLD